MSRQISQSRSRLSGLEGGVETKSRYLDRRDKFFESVEIFSTVETSSLPVSRSRVSIETMSRQIETPNLKYYETFAETEPFGAKKRLVNTSNPDIDTTDC